MFLYCFANYSGWSHTAAPLPRVLLLYCSLQLHCPQGFAGYSGLCPANPGQRFRGLFGIVSSKPGAAVSRDIRDCVQQTRGSGFAGIQGLFPANPGLRDHLESSRIFTQICGLFRILSRSSWDIRFLLFSHIGLIYCKLLKKGRRRKIYLFIIIIIFTIIICFTSVSCFLSN